MLSQPSALTATTVYSTSTGAFVVFVNESSAKSVSDKPFATAAFPADTVNPFKVNAVTL